MKEEELSRDKAQIDEYKKIKQDEILVLKKELDELSFNFKELKMNKETLGERFHKQEQDLRLSQKNSQEC